MKKVLVVLMALVLTMAMVCANAEVVTFAFAGAADLEGNVFEGDMSAYEAATITIDDEAMTMLFNDGENGDEEYTLAIAEQTEEALVMTASGADGEFTLVYTTTEDGTKSVALVVEEIQIIFIEAA